MFRKHSGTNCKKICKFNFLLQGTKQYYIYSEILKYIELF